MNIHLKFSQKILLAVSTVVVVVFAVFALYGDYQQRNAISGNIENNLHTTGQVLAQNIQTWLSDRLLLVDAMAQVVALDPAKEKVHTLLQQPALTSTFVASYRATRDGAFDIFPDRVMPDGYDPRQRPWYSDAVKNGPILTEPYIGVGSDYLVMSEAAPIKSGDQVLGVLGVNISLDKMARMINAQDFGGIGYAFLVSADGNILVHPDKTLVTRNLRDIYGMEPARIGAELTEVHQAGSTQLLTFMPVQGLPSVKWSVGLAVDKDKAYAALTQFRLSVLIATVVLLAITFVLLSLLIRLLMKPLHHMTRALEDIAQGDGDLTQRLPIQSRDEFGHLAGAFNRFVERIHGSIREVASTTARLSQVASRVVNASNASMSNSDNQSQRTSSVAAAINQLGAAAQEIAVNAADASQGASDARDTADEARRVVDRSIKAMNELSAKILSSSARIEQLNSHTSSIGQILKVIQAISEQTNLLALNAAIEAARAGESGRGFSVVADEVRNLAGRTQASAQQIQGMIEELQVGSRQAVRTMAESQQYSAESVAIANQAGEHLRQVTRRIGEIDGMNQSVAAATEEQTAVVEAINMDITQIDTLNKDAVENLNATLLACSDLEEQTARLEQLVSGFRI
jgi:methyl-accepting chemotaxis protein